MRFLLLLFTVTMLGGCALFVPYKIPVQQGHIITAKMLKQIKPGMTPDQVQFILGTPDITDPFQHNVWYYVYTNQANHLPMAEKKLKLTFNNDKLTGISGDYAPPAPLKYQTVKSS